MASFGTINSEENRSEFAVLKPGWYHVEITSGEVAQTKDKNGTMVVFNLRVSEGEGTGRVLFARFNIVNQSQEAAKIGKQQLIALADAVGITDPCDTDPFVGKHVMANVTIRPASGQYSESNDIKGFKKYDGTSVSTPTVSASAPASAPSAAGKPSWLKK